MKKCVVLLVDPKTKGGRQPTERFSRAVDELHSEFHISSVTWDRLTKEYSVDEMIEICMLVGNYHMLAFTLNSLGVEQDLLRGHESPVALPWSGYRGNSYLEDTCESGIVIERRSLVVVADGPGAPTVSPKKYQRASIYRLLTSSWDGCLKSPNGWRATQGGTSERLWGVLNSGGVGDGECHVCARPCRSDTSKLGGAPPT